MHFIPTRVHGVLDYGVGAFIALAPFLLGFAAGGAETWIPVALGLGAIVYSVFTDYELGLVRRIPMRAHLALDALSGVLLAASPWLLGFAHLVWAPHLALGLFEIAAAAMTKPTPYEDTAASLTR
jgi:hypothetical protein